MAQCSENVIPTLRDFFNSQKPGEEDEFMFHQVLNSSCKNIPPRPTKPGNKAKERHGFFNQGRSRRRNISDAEKFYVEQYSSSGFFGVRFTTNGRQQQQQQQQQQRSAKPLGSDKNMEPRLQKSFSARIQLPFMQSSKPSNQSSSSSSWFSRIKKMPNPFSNRNPLIPKSGEIKVSGGEKTLSRNKSSSPVHLHARLSIQYELGMPVFTFSLNHPDDVYMARTWMDDNDSRFIYSFRYIGGRSYKHLGEQRLNVSGTDSSLIGQMQVSTQVSLEIEEPYENPVESTMSEFVLFDIARARRSGLKHEQLSRQNSFRRGLDTERENRVSDGSNDSNLKLPRQNSFSRGLTRSFSKHSENSASSSYDPWPATELHPGLEIAAIVIRDSSSSSNESFEYMKNSKLSRREMKVIVPTGNHGLPDAEKSCPTPILQRWRSGGGCDCSGWDMGCHLFVLEEQELINNHHGLELFIEGEKEITPAMTMVFIREGHYEVNFHAKLSALQAFSVCVAELHRTEVSRGERSNSLSRCSSLRELIDMATPVNREEVMSSSFMPNVTFSPISRV
ncbi:unnamed protein product [Eruca vesicaria subsp. sativa]|uniref:Uncharacterized protein n=1 Tax=Eruca vesicaria subsp. sativa TaxID=29727 RepID=A0ABC8KRG8_ERUVS|nr:unnamed protein product [Eruca vesicaria subsp. sativa]